MSALSKRVSSLEESQAAQFMLLPYSTPEEKRLFLKSIQKELMSMAPSKPRESAEPWVIRPIPANVSVTEAFLHNIMNKITAQERQ